MTLRGENTILKDKEERSSLDELLPGEGKEPADFRFISSLLPSKMYSSCVRSYIIVSQFLRGGLQHANVETGNKLCRYLR